MSDNTNKINQQLQTSAEKQLVQVEQAKAQPPMVDELPHNLRTYQIELEMQNEELRLAQVALEASRTHYHELYDFAPTGYLTLTLEGVIAEINLTATKLLGEERQKIINQRFERFIDDDYTDYWYRHFLLAKQQGGKQTCDLPLRRADGTSLYVQINSLYTKVGNADPELRLVLTDITEHKQAEVKLRVSHLALKTISQGMLIADSDGYILSANDAFTMITGYSKAEILGGTCSFLQGPLTDTRTKQAIRLALKNSTEFSGEILNYRKDGIPFWNDLVISPVHDEDGHLTHYIGITRDITERKNAENELRIAAAAFETQEGMVVADADKVILRVNKSFSNITGYSAEDVVGKPLSILRSGRHGEDVYEHIWASVARDRYWQGEIWNKDKNGEAYPVWQIITAVTDANGIIMHNVSAFRDITLQKQAEKVLLDARQRLENQVSTTQAELEKIQEETTEINSVLNVLIKHREADIAETQVTLSHEVENTIMPFLKKLKGASAGRVQTIRLLDILETNLRQLVQSYGRPDNLPAAYQQLTPAESQVASMVRQGLSTKTIAMTLNSSPETVSIHRKHIRKKLGLGDKASNLRSYLSSLAE